MKLDWRQDCGYDGSTLVANISWNARTYSYDIRVSSHQLTEDEYIIKWEGINIPSEHLKNMCEIIYGIAKDHSNQEAALTAINVFCKLRGPQWYIP